MRVGTGAIVCVVVSGVSASAFAQATAPSSTEIETLAPHMTIAQVACNLDARATVDGRSWVIALDAFEDATEICAAVHQTAPDALHGRVRMTLGTARRPSQVIVELDTPPGTSPRAVDDVQRVLQGMAADLSRRLYALPPIIARPPPPVVVPTHPVTVPNTPIIATGFGVLGGMYFVSAVVGLAIVGASGDPGTGRFWPFVPFIGVTVFSGTYVEAPNCQCDAGRALSIIGSVIVDAAQIAGLVIGLVGIATPKTKMVAFGPRGLEVRF